MEHSEWLKTLKVGSEVFLSTSFTEWRSEHVVAVIDSETPKRWSISVGSRTIVIRKKDGYVIRGGYIKEVDDATRLSIRVKAAKERLDSLVDILNDARGVAKKMDVEDIEMINGRLAPIVAMVGIGRPR